MTLLLFPLIPAIPILSSCSREARGANSSLRYDENVHQKMHHPMDVLRGRPENDVLSTHPHHQRLISE
jgi:hypothetical protein